MSITKRFWSIMSKELCSCGKMAVWVYMPGFTSGESPFFCDNCVSRGCECNHRYVKIESYYPPLEKPDLPEGIEGVDWKWIERNEIWTHLDENLREFPCSEYMYESEGFDREINPHII